MCRGGVQQSHFIIQMSRELMHETVTVTVFFENPRHISSPGPASSDDSMADYSDRQSHPASFACVGNGTLSWFKAL